jgi:hypothetical protein
MRGFRANEKYIIKNMKSIKSDSDVKDVLKLLQASGKKFDYSFKLDYDVNIGYAKPAVSMLMTCPTHMSNMRQYLISIAKHFKTLWHGSELDFMTVSKGELYVKFIETPAIDDFKIMIYKKSTNESLSISNFIKLELS